MEFTEQGVVRGASLLDRDGGYEIALRDRDVCASHPQLTGFDVFALAAPSSAAVAQVAERCDRLGVPHSGVREVAGYGAGLDIPDPDRTVSPLRSWWTGSALPGAGGPTIAGFRLRTATSALSDWFAGFEKGYTALARESYDELLNGQAEEPSYPMTDRRRAAALIRITDPRGQINTWATDPADAFTNNRPRKPPILRLSPPADADPASPG